MTLTPQDDTGFPTSSELRRDPQYSPPPKKKAFPWWILILIVAAVLVLVGAGAIVVFGLPGLVGVAVLAAVAWLIGYLLVR